MVRSDRRCRRPGARGGPARKGSCSCEDVCDSFGLPRLGPALGLLALLASEVKADLTVNGLGLYDGANAPIVEIQSQSTGNSGVWVYGDAQTATNWTFPNGSSIPLYRIDLTHDNTNA